MHAIIIASYLTAAAAFFVATVLLALSWGGRRIGALLVLATAVSTLWGILMAYAEWQGSLAVHWVLLAEVARYGAWLVFLGALFGLWPARGAMRGLRVVPQVLWGLLAIYCLLPVTGLRGVSAWSFDAAVPLFGVLLLALVGLVLLEQILRNAQPEQRWALKFLLIALGGIFAYDVFLYSYGVLYHEFNAGAWAARGFVDALLVPLLLIAAARNRKWSLQVGVSRGVVFYSTSLLVVGCYILAVAVGGYYVRRFGGDWGRVAEITLICFAVLIACLVAGSGHARSRLRVFIQRNFFSLHHDYREQWLRLTATLAASDSDTELPMRAVRAVAQTMDSPAGALFMRDNGGGFVVQAVWNMTVPAGLTLAGSEPAFEHMRRHQWVYDLIAAPPENNVRLRAPASLTGLRHAWLLVPLILEDRLTGFVVLAQARARRAIDWEDIALLRTAGRQVAGTLMQSVNARHLAEARQFEGFNRLTAFLMHDLKNVAAQQSLLLQNATRHKRNPAFVDDMLATVDNSVRRITRLLELLRGGVSPAAPGRVLLDQAVERALKSCRGQLPVPEYTSTEPHLRVQADAEQLAGALEHLIHNAQDAATPIGHVAVGVQRNADVAVVGISDDGPGMDEAFIRDRLFKPFFTTKASRGMGIGAYQAREYVKQIGGALKVDSTPGRGTVFTLRLPIVDAGHGAGETDQLEAARLG